MKRIFFVCMTVSILLMGCSGEDAVQDGEMTQEVRLADPSEHQDERGGNQVQLQVAESYTDSDGFIHAYPGDTDSEYLSESIGLYMEYLVMIEDEERFAEQYQKLLEGFVVEENGHIFIPWRLYENDQVNALIDDTRLAAALTAAAELFGTSAYQELAENIIEAVSEKQQTEGYTVAYYDWSLDLAGPRITLSYLTKDLPAELFPLIFLEEVDESEVFFPEYFDLSIGEYSKSEEVRMIDQLLIAINREQQGFKSEKFEEWVIKEWQENHKLFGRYDRSSLEANVTYESLAMYFYLNAYFLEVGETGLAEEVKLYSEEFVENIGLEETHFFDFIHFHMMMVSNQNSTERRN